MSGRRGDQAASPARRVAYETLRRTFERREFTDRAFRSLAAELEGRERSQAQRLAYGAVQRRGSLDAVIGRLARRPPSKLDPPLLAALRLGLYELLFSDAAEHAAVNEAVALARAGGAGRGRGLVNAVLRRAVRERESLLGYLNREDSPREAAVSHSVPQWLAELWWEELGRDEALSLLRAANEPAEHGLRVNTSLWTVEEAVEELAGAGVSAVAAGGVGSISLPEIVTVTGPWGDISDWVGRGLLVPQSRGSAAAVAVLDPRPGESALELCAGPGAKTGQIAARMGGEGKVVAVEIDPERGGDVAEQAERLGFGGTVEVVVADAAELALGRRFDRVLLDAPCSDLGTLTSRPDVRWRKSPEAIERLAELQGRILERALAHLAPGGTLVYSTCTISSRENERLVAQSLDRRADGSDAGQGPVIEDLGRIHPELASSLDGRFLQIRPDRDGTTGFFIARCVYCAAPGQ